MRDDEGQDQNGDAEFKRFLQQGCSNRNGGVSEFVVDASIGQLKEIRKMMSVVLSNMPGAAGRLKTCLDQLVEDLSKASIQSIRMIDYALIRETDDDEDPPPDGEDDKDGSQTDR